MQILKHPGPVSGLIFHCAVLVLLFLAAAGQAIAQESPPPGSVIPFAAFEPRIELERRDEARGSRLRLKAPIVLDITSDGLDVPADPVSLTITGAAGDGLSFSISAGSFEPYRTRYRFDGILEGTSVSAQISPAGKDDLGRDLYDFLLEARGADLAGLDNPLTVELVIGNDAGLATVTARPPERE